MRLIDADELQEVLKVDGKYQWVGGIGTIREVIHNQPTIEIPKWIPCKERLPEESGEYLITLVALDYCEGEFFYPEVSWFYADKQVWSYRNAKVLAWMPIPEFKRGE